VSGSRMERSPRPRSSVPDVNSDLAVLKVELGDALQRCSLPDSTQVQVDSWRLRIRKPLWRRSTMTLASSVPWAALCQLQVQHLVKTLATYSHPTSSRPTQAH